MRWQDRKWLRRTLSAFAIALAVGSMIAPALAADDDDDDETIDTKFARRVLSTLGLKRESDGKIEYHERSPLVVPPTTNLPPPQTEVSAPKDVAWPNDPDANRAKQAKKKKKQGNPIATEQDDMRQLMPDELAGAKAGQPAPATQLPQQSGARPEQLQPKQLGFGGFSFDSVFNRDGKVVQFTGEPPRTSLTEPPPGLRTPSSKYPYGTRGTLEKDSKVGEDRAVFGVDK